MIPVKFLFRFLIFASLVFVPQLTQAAATLYISPATGSYKVGELFSVLLNVNTGGDPINAAMAQLNFDNSRLSVVSIGFSQSIFSLWTEEPTYSNTAGTIRFSGGLPNPGFTGSSGTILRITFKPKASGPAPVVFISGSVLANDGKGTNIVDGLKGGLFNIVAATEQPKPAPSAPTPAPAPVTAESLLSAPIITDWPKQLEAGQVLTIKGLGYPNAKILVSVQKGTEDPIVEERFAGSDGQFTYTFRSPVKSGLYRVWAKNVSPEGLVSGQSDVVTTSVVEPLFFRIGITAINYGTIIIILLALLLLLIILLGWLWIWMRKWQARQGLEIEEAEKALHHGFDRMKEGFIAYLNYLLNTKSPKDILRREELTRRGVRHELEDIEKSIEKEIEDIKKPKK
jgi:hypothetical protein